VWPGVLYAHHTSVPKSRGELDGIVVKEYATPRAADDKGSDPREQLFFRGARMFATDYSATLCAPGIGP
jgi:hypothetical protein